MGSRASHGSDGITKPRPTRRTGPDGQEKKEECGKYEGERTDEGREERRRLGLEKTKDPAVQQTVGRSAGKGWGAWNTGVSFLNLLGVCGSNKDKGSNDYSVKSMVLDCANTN